ncbi:MAG: decarboxylase [Caulobacterales bacterium]|nr:decarboxylase [Caulobacterales bacterium]
MSEPACFSPYFLGPKSENEAWVRTGLQSVLDDWFDWRKALFADDPVAISGEVQSAPGFLEQRDLMAQRLAELVEQLRGEAPIYSPRYIGHMASELALPALLGHFAALLHNPNILSKEASKVGTVIETEAIGMLAGMIGFDPALARGHFTSGGTVANLEAVWRARFRVDHRLALALTLAEEHGLPLDVFAAAHLPSPRFRGLLTRYGVDDAAMRERSAVLGNPFEIAERISRQSGSPWRGPVMLVPGHKHYSWVKAANVFGLGEEAFWTVPLDAEGRLSVAGLSDRIAEARALGRPVLMAVSVAGTTELGELDPVDAVADRLDTLRREDGIDIWHHVDAAYGGFFCALDPDEPLLAPARRRALRAIRRADTVTIDPHKLGYAPYACGALLVRDAGYDAVSSFTAPYVERTELGEAAWTRTLEGSRSATGAAATWLTGKTLGFGPRGFGAVLRSTLDSCRAIRATLTEAIPQIRPLDPTDTNIFCFSVAEDGQPLSAANTRTAAAHAAIAASPSFSMSRTVLGAGASSGLIDAHLSSWRGRRDADHLVLVRCVVMNPFWSEPATRARLLPELVAELRGIIARTAPDQTAPARTEALA